MNNFNVEPIALIGNSNIGIFSFATDAYALFPANAKDNIIKLAKDVLKVPIISTTMASSQLIGIFGIGNSKGILVSHLVSDFEIEKITSELPEEITVSILDSKLSALGNIIATTDKVALVHPEFSELELKKIESALDVEVIPYTIMENSLVGSLIFLTEKGILVHPNISETELAWLEDTFQLRVDITTINRGVPYPRLGLVANSKGILLGSDCTGPETMRIYEVLSS